MIDHLTYQLGNDYQLTIIGINGTADAWLTRSGHAGAHFGVHFDDGVPFDLASLGYAPALHIDGLDRPYVVWPCGTSALVWRCAQRAHIWMSPGTIGAIGPIRAP